MAVFYLCSIVASDLSTHRHSRSTLDDVLSGRRKSFKDGSYWDWGYQNRQAQREWSLKQDLQNGRPVLFVGMASRARDISTRIVLRRTWLNQRSVVRGDVDYRFFVPFACCADEQPDIVSLCEAYPKTPSCRAASSLPIAIADGGRNASTAVLNTAWEGSLALTDKWAQAWSSALIREGVLPPANDNGEVPWEQRISAKQIWRDHRIAAMRWALEHSNFEYYVQLDSDAYVCLDNMVHQLKLRPDHGTEPMALGYRRGCGFDDCFILMSRALVERIVSRYEALLRPWSIGREMNWPNLGFVLVSWIWRLQQADPNFSVNIYSGGVDACKPFRIDVAQEKIQGKHRSCLTRLHAEGTFSWPVTDSQSVSEYWPRVIAQSVTVPRSPQQKRRCEEYRRNITLRVCEEEFPTPVNCPSRESDELPRHPGSQRGRKLLGRRPIYRIIRDIGETMAQNRHRDFTECSWREHPCDSMFFMHKIKDAHALVATHRAYEDAIAAGTLRYIDASDAIFHSENNGMHTCVMRTSPPNVPTVKMREGDEKKREFWEEQLRAHRLPTLQEIRGRRLGS